MEPAEEVEVEARKCHDGVVPPLLVWHEQVASAVPNEAKVVEGREDRLHVCGGRGEQRDVLNIRVVFGEVGDEVVNVVRGLPPADTETAAEVGNEGADERVVDKVSCDATVAGIVCCKHDLLLQKPLALCWMQKTMKTYPEQAKEHGRCDVPLDVEEVAKGSEEGEVTQGLPGIS